VDESFRVVERLDKTRFEVWYVSYEGKPKSWYRVDHFLHQVPYEEMPLLYGQCDILLKSSLLESFSYPPLEMMASGGYVVVAPNEGNVEYLCDGDNCLFYEPGDLDSAVEAIERICSEAALREHLYKNGLATAQSRDWEHLTPDILALYDT
jgi:glycosyltransferase involved in cell wall biosynthesis